MSKVKAEFSIGLPQFLPCTSARPPRARAYGPARLKICVETYFFMPDTFGFLQFGQIQPPSMVFAELKLSGLFGLRYTRTYVRMYGHHNIVPTPTQLS